ncbi:hypothetical protein AOL_s00004g19 [Orbilia oligospora ATCC 24927]|uniref:FAD-binding PCMH-type domain-containing protein n=1 Tax=Arthrobotrys oligospora (strain ATCC 24927 / CBS 115.81 / DSM 1491) TaxID=756982 RepID=G1WXK9_ARTOA|nr:hypothetical protein AOL_s00004g19 [Orbilia oligospora ATCC 24927]EGX54370.1 hypothetical protein AOL_s00004g19 [Orbilia oligospora ATCC 24927]
MPPNNDTQSTGTTCNGIGWYPAYVINATNVEAVQAGAMISLGGENVRLVFDFTPEGCAVSMKGQNAVTISPGMQWQDMYRFADEPNSIIVGGGASTVGCIGGFLQGGGHSPLSSIYGLAVDQVLEMKVVLPSGEYITANDYQNQDIYWALGGVQPRNPSLPNWRQLFRLTQYEREGQVPSVLLHQLP